MGYPWLSVYDWAPFQVDALGLITLLGAEELNTWVGRLVPSRWLEYMPLLAINVIAGNQFLNKEPSFLLYNVTRGIHTTDMAAWFTRWIQCQQIETTRTVIGWEIAETPRRWIHYHIISGTLSFCLTGFLIVLTILSSDFYGFAAGCAIAVSVFARAYLLHANRSAIDKAIVAATPKSPQPPTPANSDKLLIITPDSNVVTMFLPGNLIVPVFVKNPTPRWPKVYNAIRWLNWGAFCVQIITLGMAVLATQIYTAVLIGVPSILICRGFGCDDTVTPWEVRSGRYGVTQGYTCWIGSRLKATVFEWPDCVEFANPTHGGMSEGKSSRWALRGAKGGVGRSAKRMDLFAWLNLTEEEKASMSEWGLLPHKRGDDSTWQDDFRVKRRLIREAALDIWDVQRVVLRTIEGNQRSTEEDCEDGVASPGSSKT